MENSIPKLIHVARCRDSVGRPSFLFLRKKDQYHYVWFLEKDKVEEETPVAAENIEEAIRLANRQWKNEGFSPLKCGFRYLLPERDEHGINALFHQMCASYGSPNGVYFDEEVGNNCFVQNASNEARDLWAKLKQEGRLGIPQK